MKVFKSSIGDYVSDQKVVRLGLSLPNGINDCFAKRFIEEINGKTIDGICYCGAIYQSANIHNNRNNIVNDSSKQKQKKFDFDMVIQIDWDIIFSLHDIYTLAIECSKHNPIITARYSRIDDPDKLHAGYWEYNKPRGLSGTFIGSDLDCNCGLQEIDWCGCGFVAVHRTVFETMEYPWWQPMTVYHDDNADIISADRGFCRNAQSAGFKIQLLKNLTVKHDRRMAVDTKSKEITVEEWAYNLMRRINEVSAAIQFMADRHSELININHKIRAEANKVLSENNALATKLACYEDSKKRKEDEDKMLELKKNIDDISGLKLK
jgi:hypothetical protein